MCLASDELRKAEKKKRLCCPSLPISLGTEQEGCGSPTQSRLPSPSLAYSSLLFWREPFFRDQEQPPPPPFHHETSYAARQGFLQPSNRPRPYTTTRHCSGPNDCQFAPDYPDTVTIIMITFTLPIPSSFGITSWHTIKLKRRYDCFCSSFPPEVGQTVANF